MYACLCKSLRESEVRQVVRSGVSTPHELVIALGLDQRGCCGRCAREKDRLWALGTREEQGATAPRAELAGAPS